jgi:heme-degrading monooxygenase HmoA
MILEVADFRTSDLEDFETVIHEVTSVIASADGYGGHTVQRSMETVGRYLLIVRWESVKHHQRFRASDAFTQWVGRLGPHREGAFVEHTETVLSNEWDLNN